MVNTIGKELNKNLTWKVQTGENFLEEILSKEEAKEIFVKLKKRKLIIFNLKD